MKFLSSLSPMTEISTSSFESLNCSCNSFMVFDAYFRLESSILIDLFEEPLNTESSSFLNLSNPLVSNLSKPLIPAVSAVTFSRLSAIRFSLFSMPLRARFARFASASTAISSLSISSATYLTYLLDKL